MESLHLQLERVMRNILHTHPHEIGCDDVYQHLDRFAELWIAGQEPIQKLPLVWDHLQHCRFCRAEFDVLLYVMKEDVN